MISSKLRTSISGPWNAYEFGRKGGFLLCLYDAGEGEIVARILLTENDCNTFRPENSQGDEAVS